MIKLKDLLTEVEGKLRPIDYPVPAELYHATFEPLINSIAKMGLVPGGTGIKAFTWSPPFVFLAVSSNGAKEILETADNPKIPSRWKDKIQVLTIDGKKLDKKKMFSDDEVFLTELGIRSIKYAGKIPPSAILDYGD